MSATLLLQIGAAVVCVNSILSAVQILFAALAKQEPGWLQSVSSVVLKISQFLGSNPPTPPAA
jgi:hypothetical protein